MSLPLVQIAPSSAYKADPILLSKFIKTWTNSTPLWIIDLSSLLNIKGICNAVRRIAATYLCGGQYMQNKCNLIKYDVGIGKVEPELLIQGQQDRQRVQGKSAHTNVCQRTKQYPSLTIQ